MSYIEELYRAGYLAEVPKDPNDVLIVPKGIVPSCDYPEYVDREYFIQLLKEQRGRDGVAEAALSTILEAPSKNDYSFFTVLIEEKDILDIYMEKRNAMEHPVVQRETVERPRTSSSLSALFKTPVEEEKETPNLENDDIKQMLDANSKSIAIMLEETNKKIMQMVDERMQQQVKDKPVADVYKTSKCREVIEDAEAGINKLLDRNAFSYLFSLDDVSPVTKNKFVGAVSVLLPSLEAEDANKVMLAMMAPLMGREADNKQLYEAFRLLAYAGLDDCKYDAIGDLCDIVLDFFKGLEGM